MAKYKPTNIGISINTEWIELTQLSKDLKSIQKSVKLPMPMATMDPSGDRIRDPQTLASSIAAMIGELNVKPPVKSVHVSVPGTLVRIVEMPKMSKNELTIALTSEAERYAAFGDTDALVDYEILSEEPDELQKILLVALRRDTVTGIKEAFDMAKLKIASLEVETISSLRGLKFSGALDSILSEVGDQPWGTIHFEPERIRIAVWQYDQIKNWREVLLDTSDLKIMGEDAPVVQDLVEEVRRTIGMTRPVVWITSGIPESLSTSLTPRLGANVRPMQPGANIQMDDSKLSIASIGICCKSYDKFPVYVDIKPIVSAESSGELLGSFKLMLAIAFILAVIFTLITIVLMGMSFLTGMEYDKNQSKISTQTNEITTLQTEVNSLQQKSDINKLLSTKLSDVVTHNESISKITDAIKNRIPDNLWLDSIRIEQNKIAIEGESLDYESIILFARNFDKNESPDGEPSPINNMSLNNIEETIDSKTKMKVYKFSMEGNPAR
ncbi:MAG: pilus assembly protein PilM [Vampirovibrionia bacterium]